MHEAYKIRKNPIPMNELTQEQREQHSKAKNCYICEKEFKIRQKVIDWSKKGNYHGACHLECTKETSAGKRNLTKEEEQDYISQTNCNKCGKDFKLDKKVHDHNHLTGEYRGPAHYGCNLNLRLPNFIVAVAHNGSKYDFKFILHELNTRRAKISSYL